MSLTINWIWTDGDSNGFHESIDWVHCDAETWYRVIPTNNQLLTIGRRRSSNNLQPTRFTYSNNKRPLIAVHGNYWFDRSAHFIEGFDFITRNHKVENVREKPCVNIRWWYSVSLYYVTYSNKGKQIIVSLIDKTFFRKKEERILKCFTFPPSISPLFSLEVELWWENSCYIIVVCCGSVTNFPFSARTSEDENDIEGPSGNQIQVLQSVA
jgi:hypothetical protein